MLKHSMCRFFFFHLRPFRAICHYKYTKPYSRLQKPSPLSDTIPLLGTTPIFGDVLDGVNAHAAYVK